MVISTIDDDHVDRGVAQATRRREPAETGPNDDHYRFAIDAHRVHWKKSKVRLYAGFCAALLREP